MPQITLTSSMEEFLFSKRVFVQKEEAPADPFAAVFALAHYFAIRVTEGAEGASVDMIRLASRVLGENVPAAFYRGFPASVKKLSPDELLFDQLAHYAATYGFGHFDRAGRSILEEELPRLAFRENAEPRDFRIVSPEEGETVLFSSVRDLLSSTRPLSRREYELVLELLPSFRDGLPPVASRETASLLLLDTRDPRFAAFLDLPDVMRLLRELWFRDYGGRTDLENLSLHNQDRKFFTRLLDLFFERKTLDERSCFEKQALWKGFLHSIHYRPKNARASFFLARIRSRHNESVYSDFERALSSFRPAEAAMLLREGKGSAAFLRRLDHVLSRCRNEEELKSVLSLIDTKNPRGILSLLFHYAADKKEGDGRHFVFTRLGLLEVHSETAREKARRRSRLSPETRERVLALLRENLERILRGRLGKVWIDPAMRKIALPAMGSASVPGFGTLPAGSRLPLPPGKKVRGFVYWELVDDIDLAVIGLSESGREKEFSWRTMADNQSGAIVYSGDQTAGFHGGSEFFDVTFDLFRSLYPSIRYLVFTANVFTGTPFSEAEVKAGFMTRDEEDSGEIFEPKTVASSFRIDSPSTFAYLFALDLSLREIVWLNLSRGGETRVAGETGFAFLLDSFGVTSVFSLYDLISLASSEVVSDPGDADLIVSDGDFSALGKEQLRSTEPEKVASLLDVR